MNEFVIKELNDIIRAVLLFTTLYETYVSALILVWVGRGDDMNKKNIWINVSPILACLFWSVLYYTR